jgi:hypothetical protein
MFTHTVIPANWQVEIWSITGKGLLGQKVTKILSQPACPVLASACDSSYVGGHGQKHKILLEKQLKQNRGRGLAQMAEHLPSKHRP